MMIEPVIPTMLLANGNVNGHFFITTSFIYFIEVDVSRLLCHLHHFPSDSFSAKFGMAAMIKHYLGPIKDIEYYDIVFILHKSMVSACSYRHFQPMRDL